MTEKIEEDLVGRKVRVKYYRAEGYPPGSMAMVIGWIGGTLEHPAILYKLAFSDGSVIFVPRKEFDLT